MTTKRKRRTIDDDDSERQRARTVQRKAEQKRAAQVTRYGKAVAALSRWTRKRKLADTKIKKLSASVRRYEKILPPEARL